MSLKELREEAERQWDEFAGANAARILVGAGTCGLAAGAQEVADAITEWLSDHDVPGRLWHVGCLGLCYAEPLVELGRPGAPGILCGEVEPKHVSDILEAYFLEKAGTPECTLAIMDGESFDDVPAFEQLPVMRPQARIVLRNCGRIDPENFYHYVARGGYAALARAVEMEPDQVIGQVKQSGLRGRGGAGFPTGTKWQFCREAPGEQKYIICNADEGDPGAFMDRSVLESDPHSPLEGLAIAAYAIGATEGYFYVRAEYPLAVKRLRKAIAQAEEHGLLGDGILGSPFSFHVKVKEGAGAFVCGEETALLASLEGRRGMPRSRPPFPAQSGLHGKPTNINNVETLANVPVILDRGSEWFAGFGTEKSRGTKTFALAGKVNRTGLVEVPLGTTLAEIIHTIGGGIPDGKQIKGVQTGGPSGGCIPASMLEMPVDYERLAEAGSIMGSGGMIVLDEETCMVDLARYFLEFTQNESCGKCVPCRLGTKQMLHLLEKITGGDGTQHHVELLEEIAATVNQAALCGLGQTAPNPVLTTLRYFRDEYQAHIADRSCAAGVCTALLRFSINSDECICCGRCAADCPADCITGRKGKAPARATGQDAEEGKVGEPFVIDQEACVKCGTCLEVCPVGAVQRV